MGYRLSIDRIKNNETINLFYGTKLYGYCDHTKLLSYNYLLQIGKFEGNEVFDYCITNEIELNYLEFKIFCILYDYDYDLIRLIIDKNIYNWSLHEFLSLDEIQQALNMKLEKYHISWL